MKTAGLFPSAQAELHKDSKHHKKKKKKTKRRHSSSGSDSSGDDQWVEKPTAAAADVAPQSSAAAQRASPATVEPAAPQRDAWMSVESVFAGVTAGEVRDRRRQTKQQAREAEERRRQADYEARKWREPSGGAAPVAPVGDGGAGWLRRALERAKQQAADSGRPLEDVVAERWGSMEKLQSMLDAAERRAAPGQPAAGERPPTAGERAARERGWRRGAERRRSGSRERRRSGSAERRLDGSRERKRSRSRERRRDSSRERRRSKSADRGRSRSNERRRSRSNERRRSRSKERRRNRSNERRRSRSNERRRSRSNERRRSRSNERRRSKSADHKRDTGSKAKSSLRRGSSADSSDGSHSGEADREDKSRRGGRKPSTMQAVPPPAPVQTVTASKASPERDPAPHSSSSVADSASEDGDQSAPESARPMTDSEMNALAAKILKAELNGDDDVVTALQKQLDAARQLRAAGGSARPADRVEKVVVVVGKGERAPAGGERSNKRRKADTHRGGERTKYFADDDRLDLRDMFERERRTTPADEAAALARLAAGGVRQQRHHDDEYGLDEQLAERAGRAEPERAQDERAAARARAQHRHVERCARCFDSRHTLRHLIAALGEKCYLALPAGRSVTEHHCLIVPLQHAVSLTALDEDGWAEMARFRAALVAMFAAAGEDVLFFESALKLRTHPHAALHCVPVPRESGELAPIYFKKALEESETEWSQNKKVVDLRGRDVRRAVPKGLPYFFVDFGLQPGFAHVVEDEDLFPDNFAQEVIGGMLELDPSAWRRSKNETLEQQRKKVMEFAKVWGPHDFTKDG